MRILLDHLNIDEKLQRAECVYAALIYPFGTVIEKSKAKKMKESLTVRTHINGNSLN